MSNPCGTTKATVYAKIEINGIPVYFGAGVNPVNSPAQFFVAWGIKILTGGLIHTFNINSLEEGTLWFVDEDEAEAEFKRIQQKLAAGR